MAIEIEELERRLNSFLASYEANRADIALGVGTLLRNDILSRVREGKDANLVNFKPYTPQYARQRANAGFQVGRVDYVRSGELHANVQARVENQNSNSVTVVIGASRANNVDKLRGAARDRGNILRANDQEIQDALTDWSSQIFDDFINSIV